MEEDSYYDLPENTSLQSRIKGLLIDGKEIYIGIGKLKDERTKNRL